MSLVWQSTNERMRQLLGHPQREAEANCRIVEPPQLTGIEREMREQTNRIHVVRK